MDKKEKAKMKEYVNRWKETGKFLEKLRIAESRKAVLEDVILSLSDASESALALYPPKPTSGLIEMQRFFMKRKR